MLCSLFCLLASSVFTQQQTSAAQAPAVRQPDVRDTAVIDETQLPISVSAQAEAAAQTATGGIGVFVRMILILALVIAALYGVVYLLKRGMRAPPNDNPYVRSVASAVLAPGRSVHVVTVGAQAFLVGVAENSVSLLGELTDKELIDAMNLHADKAPQGKPRDFASLFGRFLPGSGQKSESETSMLFSSIEETEEYLRSRRQNLSSSARGENSGERPS